MGITVLSPDLNQSEVEFTVVYDAEPNPKLACPKGKPVCQNKKVLDPLRPRIRFGLGAIKGLGGAALEAVLEARNSDDDGVRLAQSRPFESLFDFGARVGSGHGPGQREHGFDAARRLDETCGLPDRAGSVVLQVEVNASWIGWNVHGTGGHGERPHGRVPDLPIGQ